MKVELTPEEAALILFAVASTKEFWEPNEKVEGKYEPKNELVQMVLDKIITALEEAAPTKVSTIVLVV